MQTRELRAYYGTLEVLKNINLSIEEKKITVFMGPSGCGKSTLVRTLNRMNDKVPGSRTSGKVLLDGEDIYAPEVDPVLLKTQGGDGLPKAEPVPDLDLRQCRLRPQDPQAHEGQGRDGRTREESLRRPPSGTR